MTYPDGTRVELSLRDGLWWWALPSTRFGALAADRGVPTAEEATADALAAHRARTPLTLRPDTVRNAEARRRQARGRVK